MSASNDPLVLLAALVGIIALISWLGARQNAKHRTLLQQLADRLGLQVQAEKPRFLSRPPARAVGHIRGRRVEVATTRIQSGKTNQSWTVMAVTPQAGPGLTFALQRQGLGTRLAGSFGVKRLQFGDRNFDERWFVQTSHPAFLSAALLPEFRAKLIALESGTPSGPIKREHETVTYRESGYLSSQAQVERFMAVTEVMLDLAEIAEVWNDAGNHIGSGSPASDP